MLGEAGEGEGAQAQDLVAVRRVVQALCACVHRPLPLLVHQVLLCSQPQLHVPWLWCRSSACGVHHYLPGKVPRDIVTDNPVCALRASHGVRLRARAVEPNITEQALNILIQVESGS